MGNRQPAEYPSDESLFCSKIGNCEKGDEGDKGGSEHQSGWHRRMQLEHADTFLGSHVGREAPS